MDYFLFQKEKRKQSTSGCWFQNSDCWSTLFFVTGAYVYLLFAGCSTNHWRMHLVFFTLSTCSICCPNRCRRLNKIWHLFFFEPNKIWHLVTGTDVWWSISVTRGHIHEWVTKDTKQKCRINVLNRKTFVSKVHTCIKLYTMHIFGPSKSTRRFCLLIYLHKHQRYTSTHWKRHISSDVEIGS